MQESTEGAPISVATRRATVSRAARVGRAAGRKAIVRTASEAGPCSLVTRKIPTGLDYCGRGPTGPSKAADYCKRIARAAAGRSIAVGGQGRAATETRRYLSPVRPPTRLLSGRSGLIGRSQGPA